MRLRLYVLSGVLAVFGVLGFGGVANAAPCTNAIDCVDKGFCTVGDLADLQCV